MKILENFDQSLLANEDKFQDEFFQRFPLKKRQIALTEEIEKEYSFPTLYGDVTCCQAIFLCSYDAALALMPHPKVQPVRARKNLAVLAVSCYEYKNVLGIPPYNEIAFTLAVEVEKEKSPVLLPLIKNSFSGYFVFSMPVTSRENCLRGNVIWGLPKVTQEIDIDDSGAEALVKAYEDGVEYFSLRIPKQGKPTLMDETTYLYPKLNGVVHKAETNFKGNFLIDKNMGVLLSPGKVPPQPFFTLGNTRCGQVLKDLKMSPRPLQTRYVEHMTACFDYYDESYELV
ncbi:MAG: acetoacetate decarboxylase family protein [Coriobacteriia bacterium]|nr:acetoacetate decarboxylase family protein [Coriobacteriia bacterium]MCL2750896.1 acetoacetate decarboxylase family protein [Coriobacteriia bacterium]